MIRHLLIAVTGAALYSGVAFGQVEAPNALGTATTLSPTDQLYVCQTTGGCDLSGTKRLKQATVAQMIAAGAYNVLTPSGGDDYSQIHAALNNSANLPVMLRGGTFLTTQEILIPNGGILVAENGLDYLPYMGSAV